LRISCGSQFTIHDTAGRSPDPACNYTDMRSPQPNQPSRTPDFSCPYVSSTLFSSSSPISLFLVHNSNIITKHKVKSSLSISPCHDHELTPSTAYTESSAKCQSVPKPHTNLPDTPVALTSASKYFQMLPGPPRAFQSALRLCKSILRCSRKHVQLWMCIEDATRFDY